VAEFPAPKQGILLTHFIVSDDIPRSRRFYTDVLGGEVVLEGEPTIVALANGWIITPADRGTLDRTTRTTACTPGQGAWAPGRAMPPRSPLRGRRR
jgi:catechol 2,3-dioxygenase-like lactoylglutathione lyase family enzyme